MVWCTGFIPLRLLTTVLLILSFSSFADEPIRVGIPKNFPPQYSLSEDGQPTGFAIEIMEALARNLNRQVTYHVYENWDDLHRAIKSGEVEVVPNMGITSERSTFTLFSPAIETFSIRLFVRKSFPARPQLEDMAGRKIAVVKTNIGETLVEQMPILDAKQYLDIPEALFALMSGSVDGLVYPEPVMWRIAHSFGLEESIQVSGSVLREVHRAVGVSQKSPLLAKEINQAVTQLRQSPEYAQIYERWYSRAPSYWTVARLGYGLVIVTLIGLLMGGFLFWKNRFLLKHNQTLLEADQERELMQQMLIDHQRMLDDAERIAGFGTLHWEIESDQLVVTDLVIAMTGCDNSQPLSIEDFLRAVHPDDLERVRETLFQAVEVGKKHYQLEHRLLGKAGELCYVHHRGELEQVDGVTRSLTATLRNITDSRNDQLLLEGRSHVIGMIAEGEELNKILLKIVWLMEQQDPRLLGSVLLLHPDTNTLHMGVAPGLPEFFNRAVDGMSIGDGIGSCGTAAFRKTAVIVEDVEQSQYWTDFLELTRKAGIRSCWSQPIFSRDPRTVLGTFAIYSRQVMEPNDSQMEIVINGARLASIAIEQVLERDQRKRAELRAQSLLSATSEGIFGIDLQGRVIFINPVACKMLEYSCETLMHRRIHTFIHPDGAVGVMERKQCPVMEVFRSGAPSGVVEDVFKTSTGVLLPVELQATALCEGDDVVGLVVSFHDISERKAQEKQIEHLAYVDALTGVANRAQFLQELTRRSVDLERSGSAFALLMLDLDNFKSVNDLLGHPLGDQLLCAVAERLESLVRKVDLVARLGGDEFAIIQEGVERASDSAILAKKIIHCFAEPFLLDGASIHRGVSVGIVYAEHHCSPEQLMGQADMALYVAKEQGGKGYAFHSPELDQQVRFEQELVADFSNNAQTQLNAHFEPVCYLDKRVHSLTMEVQWLHPTLGLLLSQDFIPLLEKRGLGLELDRVILKIAIDSLTKRAGENISIPLSSGWFFSEETIAELNDCLAGLFGAAHPLCLVISEDELSHIDREVMKKLTQIEPLCSVRWVIDNFGRTQTPLIHLSHLPIMALNLAPELVEAATKNRVEFVLIQAIVAAAEQLNIDVVAKGVDSQQQFDSVKEAGCKLIQGAYCHQPID